MMGEIDERAHEEPVIGGTREILHEGAVDLEQVEGKTAQIAERGVAGAEIVHGDFHAEPFHRGDRAPRRLDIFDGASSR